MDLFSTTLAPPTRPDVDAADRPAPAPAPAHGPSPLSGHHRRGSSADFAAHGRRSSEGGIIMQSPASSVFDETTDDNASI
ncbi:hypothetical protein DL93DRAFT_2092147 [Clavulina sp. PMI_390]|nr:hypothetical protein DL93DRAFT_2092147 [Clavulina sp. PMI_390]